MRKFNYLCSFIVVLSVSLFIVTLGQNIVMRTSGTYLYHFNETRVVSEIYTEYTNSQMADEISGFINSWRPEEFQIYEDTGYDLEGIFDKRDSQNMMALKHFMDMSFVVCVVCLIISASIYSYFLKHDHKLVLRNRLKFTAFITLALVGGEAFVLYTDVGFKWFKAFVGLDTLAKDSALNIIMGNGFVPLTATFLIVYSLIALAVVSYITWVFTKPPRIFY